MIEDIYFEIEKLFEGEFKDKGSRFLAFGFPFKDEALLKQVIEIVKVDHPKARHFCFAYRIGENTSRSNDDGEPSGSAGKPILNVLLSKNIRNVIVIVVRYFGGTLLGVPGLINAYKTATLSAIENAVIVEKTINKIVRLSFEVNRMNDVMRFIKEFEAKILEQSYHSKYVLDFEIRLTLLEQITDKLSGFRDIEIEYLN